MTDKWIWVVRKENGEAIRIVDTEFDPELYELKDAADTSAVTKKLAEKAVEEKQVAENAEQLEKNAAAKRRTGKKAE